MGGSMASRALGVVLLAATIGLASCQALIEGPPEAADVPAATEGG